LSNINTAGPVKLTGDSTLTHSTQVIIAPVPATSLTFNTINLPIGVYQITLSAVPTGGDGALSVWTTQAVLYGDVGAGGLYLVGNTLSAGFLAPVPPISATTLSFSIVTDLNGNHIFTPIITNSALTSAYDYWLNVSPNFAYLPLNG
jgi:hypothetical protein